MIQHTIDGNLYNILSDGTEELYWSEKEINEDVLAECYRNWEDVLAECYRNWEESEFSDFNLVKFEEWWNEKYPDVYIHRVYLNQIYI
jgi:hypothetical protein